MSLEETGLYINLLACAWDSDEPGTLMLPVPGFNPRSVRSFLLSWPKTFVSSGAEFDPNLSPTEAERRLKEGRKELEAGLKFTNPKLRENWLNYLDISEKRRKAAESRYGANAEQKHQSASASAPASAPKYKSTTPPPPKGEFVLPDWIPDKTWKDFLEMRTRLRKPATVRAQQLVVKELARLKAEGFSVVEVLEQSIRKGWQDVFPIRTVGGISNGSRQELSDEDREALADIERHNLEHRQNSQPVRVDGGNRR